VEVATLFVRLEQLEMSEWDDLLPESEFGVFHTSEGLRVLNEYASGDLHLFGGFNGQQPVALFPIFIRQKFKFRMALSPPPGFGIRELGPLFFPVSSKQSKQEKLVEEFSESIINAVDADSATTLLRISTGPYYMDPRKFWWAGFDVYPTFTYQLGLESAVREEILQSFSKSLRRDIRNGMESDVTIRTVNDTSNLENIYKSIEKRYKEQQKNFTLSWAYMRDMVESLGERARVYVAESAHGDFLSGIVVLYSNDTAFFWKGGTGRSSHGFSINSLLHWRIIEDIIDGRTEQEINRYDFHTANDERIVQYKRKFNPELVPQYRIESGGIVMTAAKKAYRKIVQ